MVPVVLPLVVTAGSTGCVNDAVLVLLVVLVVLVVLVAGAWCCSCCWRCCC